MRFKRYSLRAEQAYGDWVRRFILFHGHRHPREMGAREVAAFLSHLAVEGRLSTAPRNQARSVRWFPFKEVLRLSCRCGGQCCRFMARSACPAKSPLGTLRPVPVASAANAPGWSTAQKACHKRVEFARRDRG
ncbi:MAG: phage integrase N-terminal SAM-like domain-containing protein [Candidatus Accumulibacter sp.]|nr:phage integrase N-terminal SAM-like domain-containing protein [Accumulibacter sp.]